MDDYLPFSEYYDIFVNSQISQLTFKNNFIAHTFDQT